MVRKASARKGLSRASCFLNERFHSEWAGFFRVALDHQKLEMV